MLPFPKLSCAGCKDSCITWMGACWCGCTCHDCFVNLSSNSVCSLHISAVIVLQRSTTVKVKAQDENGAKVSLSLTDFQARIFQHEYDHLQVCHHCTLPVCWQGLLITCLTSRSGDLVNAFMMVHTTSHLARNLLPDAVLGGLISIHCGPQCSLPHFASCTKVDCAR